MHINRKKTTSNPKLRIKPSTKRSSNKKKMTKEEIQERIVKSERKKTRKDRRLIAAKFIKKKNSDRSKYKDITKWRNILEGNPAFILGNGLSIVENELSLLDLYFTIGINRIFYIYDPTILFWQDRELWRGEESSVIRTKAIKVCRDISDPKGLFLNFEICCRISMPSFSGIRMSVIIKSNIPSWMISLIFFVVVSFVVFL